MKVLITGGAGFIGLHLTRRLLRHGWSVDLVDNLSRTGSDDELEEVARDPKARLIAMDLRERSALENLDSDYDVICHLAALLGVENVISRPFGTLADNVALTETVIRFAQNQRRLSRLVFASTSEVYARAAAAGVVPIPTPEGAALHLASPDDPRQSYMLSKIVGESLCHYSGLTFTIIRPHNVFGPRMGMAHVVPQLFQRIAQAPADGTLEVFSADHTRTFCYIDDAVELILRMLTEPACENRTLNLGTQSPEITIGGLAEMIMTIAGKRLRVVPRAAHPGSPARRCPDMELTNRLTGYHQRIDLAEGLRRTCEWYERALSRR